MAVTRRILVLGKEKRFQQAGDAYEEAIGLKKLKFWNIWGCPSPACFTPSVDYGGGEGVGKIGFFKLVLAISDFFKDQNPELIFLK